MVYFRQAAALHDSEAMWQLGTFYYNGEGVAKNNAKAEKWLAKAAQIGNKAARTALARIAPQYIMRHHPPVAERHGPPPVGMNPGNRSRAKNIINKGK